MTQLSRPVAKKTICQTNLAKIGNPVVARDKKISLGLKFNLEFQWERGGVSDYGNCEIG